MAINLLLKCLILVQNLDDDNDDNDVGDENDDQHPCMHAHVLVFASNTVLCLEKLLVLRYGYLLMPVFDEHSYCQSLSSVCYNP